MPDEGNATKSPKGDPQIKVTDKRMFTADGELREEYRFLERPAGGDEAAAAERAGAESPAAPAAPPPPASPAPESGPGPGPGEPPVAAAPPDAAEPAPGPERRPELPEFSGPGSASFLDLVAMLAESAAVYLGDTTLPDGSSAEQLDMARLHIDLLDVLRQKSAGNLSVQESAALEDVLYRLRVRYVQKRG